MFIEVITTNLNDSISAEALKINRLELVKNLDIGGLTPELEVIFDVCNNVSIPVNIMLRNQANSFVYSDTDMQIMLEDLENIKKTKANGIVFGCLDKDGNIDELNLQKIISNKEHLKLTFHRAIDECADYFKALNILSKYSDYIDIILTSGHAVTANKGLDNIIYAKKLLKDKITILAGAGLKENNIFEFMDISKVEQVHLGSGARIENIFENNLSKIFLDKLGRYKKT